LALDGSIRERSPVVITIPAAFPGQNLIVGESLFDFLCLGTYRGYFCPGELAYDPELTLRARTDPSWKPSEDRHYELGFGRRCAQPTDAGPVGETVRPAALDLSGAV
jgi:hypothetical protein